MATATTHYKVIAQATVHNSTPTLCVHFVIATPTIHIGSLCVAKVACKHSVLAIISVQCTHSAACNQYIISLAALGITKAAAKSHRIVAGTRQHPRITTSGLNIVSTIPGLDEHPLTDIRIDPDVVVASEGFNMDLRDFLITLLTVYMVGLAVDNNINTFIACFFT